MSRTEGEELMERELFFAVLGLISVVWVIVVTIVIWALSKIPDILG